MKSPLKIYILAVVSTIVILTACNLEREIDIDLPQGEKKLVVECYLQHGRPYRLLLTETVSFLDNPGVPDVNSASVVITHNGEDIVLQYKPTFDTLNGKVYNYVSDNLVDSTGGGTYELRINDRGRSVTAQTSFLPHISMNELIWEFEDKDDAIKDDKAKALILLRHNDAPNTNDFYRLLINLDSLQGEIQNDFIYRDQFSTNNEITVSTRYKFDDGDTLIVSLYHIEKQFYDYLRSLDDANDANGNPFAQPAPILSGVEGGIGIFTTLALDRQQLIIKK